MNQKDKQTREAVDRLLFEQAVSCFIAIQHSS